MKKRDLWEGTLTCWKCNSLMKKAHLKLFGRILRGWRCEKDGEAVVHPIDAEYYLLLNKMAKKSKSAIKILEFLLTHAGLDYSKTQVAREIGFSRATIETIWRKLEAQGLIKKTRKLGNSQLFEINKENPEVKMLAHLEYELAKAKNGKEFERQTFTSKNRQ